MKHRNLRSKEKKIKEWTHFINIEFLTFDTIIQALEVLGIIPPPVRIFLVMKTFPLLVGALAFLILPLTLIGLFFFVLTILVLLGEHD